MEITNSIVYNHISLSAGGLFMLFRKKSFGQGYMYPIYPFNPSGLLDYIVVVPKKVLGRKEARKIIEKGIKKY